MGINDDMERTGNYLFSKTRRGLLTMLYNHPGEAFYVNQIVKDLGSGSGAVQRELRMATEAGLISRERRGNLVLYRANQDAALFSELKNIIDKTSAGVVRPYDLTAQRFKVAKSDLEDFCYRHHINKLSLYGPVLQKEFGPENAINVLAEFLPGYAPGFGIADVEDELSRLAGHKVELRAPGELSRYRKVETARQARVIYATPRTKK
jgi:uncharacterized protein